MMLRTRVGLAGGAVVLLALATASLVVYPTVRANLRHQTDESLVQAVGQSPMIARQLKEKIAVTGDTAPIDTPVTLGSSLVQFITRPVFPGSNKAFIDVTDRDANVASKIEPAY